MRKPLLLVGGALALLLLLGFLFRSTDDESNDLLVQPEVGPFEVLVTTTGELRAKRSVEIYGPRNAQQVRIFEMKISRLVDEGTYVEPGDFVAELDRSQLTTQIKDAEIELQKATSQFTQARLDTALTLSEARDQLIDLRYSMEEALLRKEQAVYEPPSVRRQAEIDYEKAERNLERSTANYQTKVQQAVAKMSEVGAEVQKARNQYNELMQISGEFTVLAPEKGMVIYAREWGGRRKEVGSTVRAWDPVVATLPDLSVMETLTYVNEVDIQKIKVGLPVEIGLDAMPELQLSGIVSRIANIGEQRPGSDAKVFEVIIEINESDSTLRPAMTTSNIVEVASLDEAMSIPLECIHAEDSLTYVYVRDGSRARKQEVFLGLLNENAAVVEAGVEADDWLYLSLPDPIPDTPIAQLDPDIKAELEARKATPSSSAPKTVPSDEPPPLPVGPPPAPAEGG